MPKNPFENNDKVTPIERGHEIAREAMVKSFEERALRLILNIGNFSEKERVLEANKLKREMDGASASLKEAGRVEDMKRLSDLIDELDQVFFEGN